MRHCMEPLALKSNSNDLINLENYPTKKQDRFLSNVYQNLKQQYLFGAHFDPKPAFFVPHNMFSSTELDNYRTKTRLETMWLQDGTPK